MENSLVVLHIKNIYGSADNNNTPGVAHNRNRY